MLFSETMFIFISHLFKIRITHFLEGGGVIHRLGRKNENVGMRMDAHLSALLMLHVRNEKIIIFSFNFKVDGGENYKYMLF